MSIMKPCWHGIALLATIMCLCLSACGFHLRGYAPQPEIRQRLVLVNQQPFGDFARTLQTALRQHFDLVDAPSNAAPHLVILSAQAATDYVNATSLQVSRQMLLRFIIRYQLESASGQVLQTARTVEAQTQFVQQQNAIQGSNVIAAEIQRSLIDEAVNRLLSQLASTQTQQLLHHATA